jgi:glycerol-3-phosphate acyltransferase PlsY
VTGPPLVPAALLAGAYLLGSVPFGLILSRALAGVDVRRVGSGNIGATNVSRAAGKKVGILTLVLDAAKGALPVLVAQLLGLAPAWGAAAGIAAFLGHLFPPWLGFKGGKGVATALGVSAAFAPLAALAGILVFSATLAATRFVSVGSLLGTAACAAAIFAVRGAESPASWAGAAMAVVIVVRHLPNVRRLRRGEENRI